MTIKLLLQILIAVVGYCMWGYIAWCDPAARPDFLKFNIAMTVGTIGLALRDMRADASEPGASAGDIKVPIDKQGGYAQAVMLPLLAGVVLIALSACSLLPQTVARVEEGAAQTLVQSSERAICRDLPIGAWMRMYGTSVDRLKGWQALCFNPFVAPLNDATIAAILKVYPGFDGGAPASPPPGGPVSLPAAAADSGSAGDKKGGAN